MRGPELRHGLSDGLGILDLNDNDGGIGDAGLIEKERQWILSDDKLHREVW